MPMKFDLDRYIEICLAVFLTVMMAACVVGLGCLVARLCGWWKP